MIFSGSHGDGYDDSNSGDGDDAGYVIIPKRYDDNDCVVTTQIHTFTNKLCTDNNSHSLPTASRRGRRSPGARIHGERKA